MRGGDQGTALVDNLEAMAADFAALAARHGLPGYALVTVLPHNGQGLMTTLTVAGGADPEAAALAQSIARFAAERSNLIYNPPAGSA